ncbi:hypothetical protein GCM10010145_61310 [Streptomyces ruber]|uniref:Secreted protein n=2 Tax=Streptomyces TaxID=1883 RepID=A0A918EWS9_9ACTN|nr:hypothetical protein [Streptomyces ruber]GGQ83508.1 hypothetical protein GCM10010145_61310 [Streptomyces ruber]
MSTMMRKVVLVTGVAAAMLAGPAAAVGQAADEPGQGIPALIVSPAPGKITKERKITDTYNYAPGGSSSQQSSSSSAPQPPEPGPVTNLKDTANSTVQSATSGASSTVDSALK